MAMNIYSDTPNSGPISFAVQWDNTKFLADGTTPDPAFMEWYQFPAADMGNKPATPVMTNAQYRTAYAAQCQGEARALAKLVRQAANRAARQATGLGVPTVDNS